MICWTCGVLNFSVIYKGMIWFLMSHLMIIWNDIFAYWVGSTLGRTKLIKVSPKKTLEGYLGGMLGCIIVSVFSA